MSLEQALHTSIPAPQPHDEKPLPVLEKLTSLSALVFTLVLGVVLPLVALNFREIKELMFRIKSLSHLFSAIKSLFHSLSPVSNFIATKIKSTMDPYDLPQKTPAMDRADQDLNVIEFNRGNFCEQFQSPLFSLLPGEIRDRIFAYTLAEFEDTSTAFDNNSCYRRPEYAALRRSDTALLRTCQRVYEEAFFYPFALAKQILWLAWADRRPSTVTTIERLKPSLALMQKLHGDTELDSVRVFAQLCNLESGENLNQILNMAHFSPKSMTITIRHTDMWNWETDVPITIGGHWTKICRFPRNLRCLNVQVESLERRKDQIDYIVGQMIEKWRFTRRDHTSLQANPGSASITRWSGSSTWENRRWLRDESRPETVDYYVATVPFYPIAAADMRPRIDQGDLQLDSMPNTFSLQHASGPVAVAVLQAAHVPAGLSAEEVLVYLETHRRELHAPRLEALRLRRERQRLAAERRRAAQRVRKWGRSLAEMGSAYPHQAARLLVEPQSATPVVSTDDLRAARAERRRDLGDGEVLEGVDWFDDTLGGRCGEAEISAGEKRK